MQVTVTRTLTLPDHLTTINELEERIVAFGRSLMQEVMKESWQLYQEAHWECKVCGSQQIGAEGYKSFGLLTLFGRVELKRHRVKCHSCGHYTQPQDGHLEGLGGGHATKAFRELACLSGASWPYEQASDVLKRMTGSAISHEQVRRLTIEAGEEAAQLQMEQAQQVLKGQEPSPTHPPDMVLVALDGGWIHSLDNPEGMEGKVAVASHGSKQVGKDRRALEHRRYAGSFHSSEALGKLCYKEAFSLGIDNAPKQAVIGDGASWISSIAQEHFPRAKRILDLWHLERRLWEAVNCGLPEHLREEAIAKLKAQLRNGKVQEALRGLKLLLETFPGPKLGEFVRYVSNNASWIADYHQLQCQGYPVGSGAVEKGVDIVINRRFKGRRGMRWKRANANAIVALRVLELNEDWDSYWQRLKAA